MARLFSFIYHAKRFRALFHRSYFEAMGSGGFPLAFSQKGRNVDEI